MKLARDFALEIFYSQWEFDVRYNLSSTDMESMTVAELLSLGDGDEAARFAALHLGYTPPWGGPGLREAIAETYPSLSASNVLCFAGSEEGLFVAMNVLLDREDHALVVVPAYQSAETVPASVCDTSVVMLDADDGWQLDPDELEAALKPNTRVVYINFPNNPTGALLSLDRLARIVSLCERRGIYLFSDEVFRGSEKDSGSRLPAVADLTARGVSLGGTSKVHGLAGLRIGWLASQDEALLQRMVRFKHYLTICSSAPSEYLATLAVRHQEQLFARTMASRSTVAGHFKHFFATYPHLFDFSEPPAGLFAYPRFRGPGTAEDFCRAVLAEAGVLLAPSSLFASSFAALPADRFRVGFTRRNTPEGLRELSRFLDRMA